MSWWLIVKMPESSTSNSEGLVNFVTNSWRKEVVEFLQVLGIQILLVIVYRQRYSSCGKIFPANEKKAIEPKAKENKKE